MDESWIEIPDFSKYAASNFGRVMNLRRGTIVRPMKNLQGLATVGMVGDEGRHSTRSVALLVASLHLGRPDDLPDHFDTPVNLDGYRMHNHVHNLMWRPRWYAVKYHRQFETRHFLEFPRVELQEVTTRETFDNVPDASTRYGIYYGDIVLSFMNNVRVALTGHSFRLR